MVDKKIIFDFVGKKSLCVLATADVTGRPEAAVMAYAAKGISVFYFFTEPETRKYQNLLANKRASVVIGGWENDPTVQLDGLVKELEGHEAEEAREFTLSAHPEWQDYYSSNTGKWFYFKPLWLRYSNFNQNPPVKHEMRLDFRQDGA